MYNLTVFLMHQVAAKRLKADASEYKRSPIVETAKRVANMWLEMAQLIRSELFHSLIIILFSKIAP